MRKFRKNPARGLPPKRYRASSAEILKFYRRGDGGQQYLELEKALDRIQATRVKIVSFKDKGRRQVDSVTLIGEYKVVSRTTQNRIEQLEMVIPDWVYEGVVNPNSKTSILTLNRDYFLILKPLARFVYRLARKTAGKDKAYYSFTDLHHRSGSSQPLYKFYKAIEDLVAASKNDPIPDYNLSIKNGRGSKILVMENGHKNNFCQRSVYQVGCSVYHSVKPVYHSVISVYHSVISVYHSEKRYLTN